jgi:predicted RNA binding protein YcfA (HicA-like mRNA interferase family)
MAQLPNLSGKEVVETFENLGWEFSRQSGSHIVLTKDGEMA